LHGCSLFCLGDDAYQALSGSCQSAGSKLLTIWIRSRLPLRGDMGAAQRVASFDRPPLDGVTLRYANEVDPPDSRCVTPHGV
jgi:hypothetical protein